MRAQQIEAYARLKPLDQSNPNQEKIFYNTLTQGDNEAEIFEVISGQNPNLNQTVCNLKPSHSFKFRKIFDDQCSQEKIFTQVAAPLVLDFMEGYNGTIFAYGQTGSGKTYTMSGGPDWNIRGIIPRVFSLLFSQINHRTSEIEYDVFASYLEIYNECGYDLLESKHAEEDFKKWKKISLYEDKDQNLHMRNLSIHQLHSEQEAIDLLYSGNYIRQVSSTHMNHASSRSHCIFTLGLEGRNLKTLEKFNSKLHLVDLAGSERVYKSDPDIQLKKEAKYINRSLSYLEQVILALHEREQGNREHVPYRNSMMTSILRDSLGGNCRTVMLANLSLHRENEDETISTARFAIRCQKLINHVQRNTHYDLDDAIYKLQLENENLKKTIIRQNEKVKQQNYLLRFQLSSGSYPNTPSSNFKSPTNEVSSRMLPPGSGVSNGEVIRFLGRELTGDEIFQCEVNLQKYLASNDDEKFEIELHNLNEVNEYFRIFKDHYRRLTNPRQHTFGLQPPLSQMNLRNQLNTEESNDPLAEKTKLFAQKPLSVQLKNDAMVDQFSQDCTLSPNSTSSLVNECNKQAHASRLQKNRTPPMQSLCFSNINVSNQKNTVITNSLNGKSCNNMNPQVQNFMNTNMNQQMRSSQPQQPPQHQPTKENQRLSHSPPQKSRGEGSVVRLDFPLTTITDRSASILQDMTMEAREIGNIQQSLNGQLSELLKKRQSAHKSQGVVKERGLFQNTNGQSIIKEESSMHDYHQDNNNNSSKIVQIVI